MTEHDRGIAVGLAIASVENLMIYGVATWLHAPWDAVALGCAIGPGAIAVVILLSEPVIRVGSKGKGGVVFFCTLKRENRSEAARTHRPIQCAKLARSEVTKWHST